MTIIFVVGFSLEAITLIGGIVTAGAFDIFTGNTQNLGELGTFANDQFAEIGASVLNTFLSEVMIVAGDILTTIGDVIKALSYLAGSFCIVEASRLTHDRKTRLW